jgi:hypothetical protein
LYGTLTREESNMLRGKPWDEIVNAILGLKESTADHIEGFGKQPSLTARNHAWKTLAK